MLLTVCGILCVCILVITYGNSKNIPSWDDVYRWFGFYDNSELTRDFVRVMDVGQGDSVLISSNGYSAVMDTGTPESAAALCSSFANIGVRQIDAVLISHLHMDHVGGLEDLADRFAISNLIVPDLKSKEEGLPAVKAASEVVSKGEGGVYTAISGMTVTVGDFDITLLAVYYDMSSENNRSVFAMARIGDIRFLMTGDAESEAEKRLLGEKLDLSCDVLKVGHHGSSSSSSDSFLDACRPRYAAISCGLGNQYSHPHEETLARLEKHGAEIYRTDLSGDITFLIENNALSVMTER